MKFDDKFLNFWNWFINSKIMTLLQFKPGEPVQRTGFRTHFLQNSKFFIMSNKIYTKSFHLMRFDDKFLNWLNWFINSKIMTLLQFNPGEPVPRTGFRTSFLQNSKIF